MGRSTQEKRTDGVQRRGVTYLVACGQHPDIRKPEALAPNSKRGCQGRGRGRERVASKVLRYTFLRPNDEQRQGRCCCCC